MITQSVRLSELYPEEYKEFWNTKAFYVACKGSKGSCKSTTTALWHIYMMMRYPEANTLVIRNVFGTIKDSCYTDLLWAIDTLGVSKFWKSSVNPLQLTYLPTGQVILFRGMDDALKIAGIKVRHGYLCWVWWEEFSDISNEGEFDKVMMSIRGRLPPETHLWKRCTMTFNPWSEHHFSKRRFFDTERDNTLAMTTTYKCNRWLGEDDIARYDEMYITSPRQARIICDGDWGIADGLIYENWREERFDIKDVIKAHPDLKFTYGLDFGFAVDPAAFVAVAVDIASNTIWIFDEIYEIGLDNMELAKRIVEMGYGKKTIVADSAEPKSIFELKRGFKEFVLDDKGEQLYDEATGEAVFAVYQLPNIRSAFKGADSLKNGIRRVQGFNIVVHPKCVNFMMELNNYSWAQDKDGNFVDKPIDEFNHCLVAGTMVITDHGDVPIEDVRVGDMVLTHLGYREVTASGVTRPEPTEIWRMELENGAILEGTADHPIPTTDGLKYLDNITQGTEVILCQTVKEDQETTISPEISSNMMGSDGIAARQMCGKVRNTIVASLLKRAQPCISTDTSGRRQMVQFLKDIRSTISMGTRLTTNCLISNACLCPNTVRNTQSRMRKGPIWRNRCAMVRPVKKHARHGMHLRKDTNGMSSMQRKSQRICNLGNTYVSIAGQNTQLCHSELTNSVQTNAELRLEETRGLTTRKEFVSSVARLSKSINTQKSEPAPNLVPQLSDGRTFVTTKVKSLEKTSKKKFVYDLTVDEAHDFFANGILVLNCMDATRYALNILLSSGTSYITETSTEEPVMIAEEKPKRKCRRVFSTSD